MLLRARAQTISVLRYTSRALSTRPEPSMAERLDTIGTRRIFNEEHDLIRETARRFFADQVAPFHDKWEEDGKVSRTVWEEAGSLGLLGSETVNTSSLLFILCLSSSFF